MFSKFGTPTSTYITVKHEDPGADQPRPDVHHRNGVMVGWSLSSKEDTKSQSNAPSGEVHAGVESPFLEAAEAGAAEVEPGGDELHIPFLQDVFDNLRRGINRIKPNRTSFGRTTRRYMRMLSRARSRVQKISAIYFI